MKWSSSIQVSSSLKEDVVEQTGCFSPKQSQLITNILAEASGLLGEDARGLPLTSADAETLGFPPGTTFGKAFTAIATTGTGAAARDFTRLVLALRQDERV